MITVKSGTYSPGDFYALLAVVEAGEVMICGGICSKCENKMVCYDLKAIEEHLKDKLKTVSKLDRS